MAQRELQVTRLAPQARSMDTFVRPTFENNQAAINRLTTSIKKTDDDRAIKEAELDAVSEALAGGVKDLHNRELGHSSNPLYAAKRYELRGANYAGESVPGIFSAYEEFKLSATDDPEAVNKFLDEQFAPILANLQGEGGQFLMAGAASQLTDARNKILAAHQPFLDNRAHEETIVGMGLEVDRIVHTTETIYGGQGDSKPMPFKMRIQNLDNLAVDFENTTPIKKGEGNKLIFDSLMSMAAAADPEDSEKYLHMAQLVRYSKGKDGAIRPEAMEKIAAQERLNESKQTAMTAAELKKQIAAQKVADEAAISAGFDFVLATDGAVVPSDEMLKALQVAGQSPTQFYAMQTAVANINAGIESDGQLKNFNSLVAGMNNNRQNPNMVANYNQISKLITDGNLHPSRIKELYALAKTIEQASPIIKNSLITSRRKSVIAGLVEQNETGQYDITNAKKKAGFELQFDRHIQKLIREHYNIGNDDYDGPAASSPSTALIESWAEQAEAHVLGNESALVTQIENDKVGLQDMNSSINIQLKRSQDMDSGEDGKFTALYSNTIGRTNETTLSGNVSPEYIDSKINELFKSKLLTNPAAIITKDTVFGRFNNGADVGKTYAELIDLMYGPSAFYNYYSKYGSPKATKEMYKAYKLTGD